MAIHRRARRRSWLFLLVPCAALAQADTTAFRDTASASVATSYLYGALSASHATSTNWAGATQRSFALTGNLLYRHALDLGTRGHLHAVMADLGYLRIADSTWAKSLDRFQVALLWSAQGRRWKRSWTAGLSTQFLPTPLADTDPDTGLPRERRVGGPLSPFSLDAGYGAVWSFWGKSAINFAFASLRLTGSPKELTAPAFADAHTAQSGGAYYFLTYGFFLSALVDRSFGTRVQWLNNTRLSGNGITRDDVYLQCSNMVIVKLWKYVQLRLDTRVAYDPLSSYDLQFRQEVLLGLFYERNGRDF